MSQSRKDSEKICKYCAYRRLDQIGNPECTNFAKIREREGLSEEEIRVSDMLVYSYNEDGAFYVGDNFGCIHWKRKD